jgi:hypothetical protein
MERPFPQLCHKLVMESIKIFAVKKFLEYLQHRFFHYPSKIYQADIYETVVLMPIIEEICFHLILRPGIQWIQLKLDHGKQDQGITRRKERQQIFRIHLISFIFAAAHLFHFSSNKKKQMITFVWAYFGGVICGYLSEKYHSLAPAILTHGLNNCLYCLYVAPGKPYRRFAPYIIIASFINRIAFYILAVTSIDRTVLSALGRVKNSCFSSHKNVSKEHK